MRETKKILCCRYFFDCCNVIHIQCHIHSIKSKEMNTFLCDIKKINKKLKLLHNVINHS